MILSVRFHDLLSFNMPTKKKSKKTSAVAKRTPMLKKGRIAGTKRVWYMVNGFFASRAQFMKAGGTPYAKDGEMAMGPRRQGLSRKDENVCARACRGDEDPYACKKACVESKKKKRSEAAKKGADTKKAKKAKK